MIIRRKDDKTILRNIFLLVDRKLSNNFSRYANVIENPIKIKPYANLGSGALMNQKTKFTRIINWIFTRKNSFLMIIMMRVKNENKLTVTMNLLLKLICLNHGKTHWVNFILNTSGYGVTGILAQPSITDLVSITFFNGIFQSTLKMSIAG